MIRLHASAVFQVRDGFTGRVLEGGGLLCALDGASVRPLFKPGGYLVLVNLAPGPHRLTLRAAGFQEEQADFACPPSAVYQGYLALKPAPGRPLPPGAAVVRAAGLEPGRPVWLTVPGGGECRVAQTQAEAGSEELRLFPKGNPPVPGPFLADDPAAEIVVLSALEGEAGRLSAPLSAAHGRSCPLLPAQCYRADREGGLTAAFPRPGPLVLFQPGRGVLARAELKEGVQELTLDL